MDAEISRDERHLAWMSWMEEVARCPCCHGKITFCKRNNSWERAYCENAGCSANSGFPFASGQPVLVDFANSVLDPQRVIESSAESPIERKKSGYSRLLKRLLTARQLATEANVQNFLRVVKSFEKRPVVLVIGGGSIGEGAMPLYTDSSIQLVGT